MNAKEAKNAPVIEFAYNEVTITQYAEIVDVELLPLLDFVMEHYQLTQKGYIAFGIIAKEKKVLSTGNKKNGIFTCRNRGFED